nr:MAG TPA: hypothetical protein [Caudoviricetes sp.]
MQDRRFSLMQFSSVSTIHLRITGRFPSWKQNRAKPRNRIRQ